MGVLSYVDYQSAFKANAARTGSIVTTLAAIHSSSSGVVRSEQLRRFIDETRSISQSVEYFGFSRYDAGDQSTDQFSSDYWTGKLSEEPYQPVFELQMSRVSTDWIANWLLDPKATSGLSRQTHSRSVSLSEHRARENTDRIFLLFGGSFGCSQVAFIFDPSLAGKLTDLLLTHCGCTEEFSTYIKGRFDPQL